MKASTQGKKTPLQDLWVSQGKKDPGRRLKGKRTPLPRVICGPLTQGKKEASTQGKKDASTGSVVL